MDASPPLASAGEIPVSHAVLLQLTAAAHFGIPWCWRDLLRTTVEVDRNSRCEFRGRWPCFDGLFGYSPVKMCVGPGAKTLHFKEETNSF